MPSICVQIVLNHCIWHICAMLQQILTKLSWYSIHPLYLIVLCEVTSILRECYMYYMYHSCQMDDILLQRSFQADSWLSRHGVGSVWTCQSWHLLPHIYLVQWCCKGRGCQPYFNSVTTDLNMQCIMHYSCQMDWCHSVEVHTESSFITGFTIRHLKMKMKNTKELGMKNEGR